MVKRKNVVTLRLDDEERNDLNDKAEKAKLNVNDFLRLLIKKADLSIFMPGAGVRGMGSHKPDTKAP